MKHVLAECEVKRLERNVVKEIDLSQTKVGQFWDFQKFGFGPMITILLCVFDRFEEFSKIIMNFRKVVQFLVPLIMIGFLF